MIARWPICELRLTKYLEGKTLPEPLFGNIENHVRIEPSFPITMSIS